ncbi:hypothetical protein CAOG_009979 [Capsaspora owczarzaki ATCC 30864]|uniref:LRRNT domain-containing protein n=1 Tax=Capsaspora owczarzaki (strain ATCC 30864) TaxID=595528 RepID=A0A0D2WTR3_CAPO3|nr:hypothetical protein CAOG_009979 [Capsaspora owczarzaki ATCC 30864]
MFSVLFGCYSDPPPQTTRCPTLHLRCTGDVRCCSGSISCLCGLEAREDRFDKINTFSSVFVGFCFVFSFGLLLFSLNAHSPSSSQQTMRPGWSCVAALLLLAAMTGIAPLGVMAQTNDACSVCNCSPGYVGFCQPWLMVDPTQVPYNIPPETTDLDLTTLQLSYIPYYALMGLSSLNSLSLSGVSYIENGAFADLALMTTLTISFDSSVTTLAVDWSGVSSLYSLNLNGPNLSELPDSSFSGLGSLIELSVSGPLTTLGNWLFLSTPMLNRLSLYSNQLPVFPKLALSPLSSLMGLNLQGSRFTSLPSDAFATLTSLSFLDLSNTLLTAIPDDVFASVPLGNLYLGQNTNLGPLSGGAFRGLGSTLVELFTSITASVLNLPQLQRLDLSSNQLTSLPDGLFSNCPQLTSLSLHSNSIAYVGPAAFSGLVNLLDVNLHGLHVTTLSASTFAGLTSLTSISLHVGMLETIPPHLFDGLQSLQTM